MIETIISRNISRHFSKLKEKLIEVNTAQIVIDAISKEFRFLEKDLKEELVTKEGEKNGLDKTINR